MTSLLRFYYIKMTVCASRVMANTEVDRDIRVGGLGDEFFLEKEKKPCMAYLPDFGYPSPIATTGYSFDSHFLYARGRIAAVYWAICFNDIVGCNPRNCDCCYCWPGLLSKVFGVQNLKTNLYC